MRQIFLLVVFIFAARWLVKTMRAAQTGTAARGAAGQGASRGQATGAAPPQRGPRQLAEPMVRCAVCGVHAPKSDSIAFGAQYFCSVDHARRHAAAAGGRDGR
ncbi:PP0621 family protein [Trinickia diaoshuihuensis]|uniref:PP0621 family protein n=1 Tax=Trinickia diaoshuihuensis TaxID=2292265 RepID=UPI000E26C64F|nr:PP0621 family protein [Trinickia diaoshuihuensis]